MDREILERADAPTPDPREPQAELWAQAGGEHERRVAVQLQAEHGELVRPERSAAATLSAMREGRAVILQATLVDGAFAGIADFLICHRAAPPSRFGGWSYSVADAKLARSPKPYALIQLCSYAEMLENAQGVRPPTIEIFTGDGERRVFRTDDCLFYFRCLKRAFFDLHASWAPQTCPSPIGHADHGRWTSHAEALLVRRDDPARVAGITRGQIKRLAQVGITTMAALAESGLRRVPRMDDAVYARLRDQSRLQIMSRGRDRPSYAVLEAKTDTPRAGLGMLPPSSAGDVFFDMEGFPLADGGLEYLFGAYFIERGLPQYTDWWAHDAAEERIAFQQVVDWLFARFRADPAMHIYHYAPYEVSALRRLMGSHATRGEELDTLMRHEVFVDLHKIVRNGVRIGEPRYSLKNVEHLYRPKRATEVASAAESIVEYARWVAARDGDSWQTSRILAGIRSYNRDDCESTWQLATWLRERQREARIPYTPPRPRPPDEAPIPQRWQAAENVAAQLDAVARAEQDPEKRRIAELIAQLVTFHRREDKPYWWQLYERRRMTVDELREDPDCIADVRRTERPPDGLKESLLYEYSFDPDQESGLQPGDRCEIVPSERMTVRVHTVDLRAGRIVLSVGEARELPPGPCSLIPYDHVPPDVIAASIRRTAERWLATRHMRSAVLDLLSRGAPRVTGHVEGYPLVREGCGRDDEIRRVLSHLDESCVSIQGPPGTGKTYTAARQILSLVGEGRRVAISSNSHNAIEKLMLEAHAVATEANVHVSWAKVGDSQGGSTDDLPFPTLNVATLVKAASPPQIVGATAWALSAPELEGAFDYLFVDEAGQVSLANLVGMAACARNIVLVGDQMQLSQPVKGSHPGESGSSALAYLLRGHAVVPADRGILLPVSRRMHPQLCQFVSNAFYDGRLTSDPTTEQRWLRPRSALPGGLLLPSTGLAFAAVPHAGNSRSSEEERDVIVALHEVLKTYDLVTNGGAGTRALSDNDILIVTPYNAQVHLLQEALPNARVGTVDRFQGQEAAVVLVSMSTSADENSPRGIEFLFSANRLNVALSRAQVLAIVVGDPGLCRTRVTNAAQLRQVNTFCRIAVEAVPLAVTPVAPRVDRSPARRTVTRGPDKPISSTSSRARWSVDEKALADFTLRLAQDGSFEWFNLRRDAEQLALLPSFDRLITLDCNDIKELPHQIAVVKQVLRKPMSGRALLADEVGLGKTIEAAIVYKELAARGLVRRTLILTPAALVDQWREELAEKFFEEFQTPREPEDWTDAARAVISYDRARQKGHADALLRHRWDLVIVDEAHKLKNHKTQRYRFLQQIERNFILLLTATPLQNNLRELYNLVTLLRPGQLGTWSQFCRKYVQAGDLRKAKNPDDLRELTAHVMVRTRRANVAAIISLPPRRPEHPPITLSPDEASLYREATRFLRDLYKDGFYQPDEEEEEQDRVRKRRYTGRGNLSRMIIMLCQRLCSSAAALAESLENLAAGELILPAYRARALDLAACARTVRTHAKLDALAKILAATPERFIVFSEHLATLKLIEERVKALGRMPIIFAGTVPRPERNQRILLFRNTPGAVFIATRAGSEGLNLQDGCSRIINYELPWNPMVVEQRIGRVHRIGQQHEVRIFNFAASSTVETHVLRLLDQKIKLFELVIGELDVILGRFGEPEDLEKQLREAWLSSDSDEEFEAKVTQIGDAITASREDGREQERLASEVAAEDPGTRLVQQFGQLTVAARLRLAYGTVHLTIARGVDAKRRQLGLRVPEIIEALDGAHAEPAGAHDDFGPVFRVTGVTARAREVHLVVAADRLPMVLVDMDTEAEAPLVADV